VPIDPDLKRQQPGLDLAHVASPANFLAGRLDFDLDGPPPNPHGWQALARDLEERCKAFVSSARLTTAGSTA
jgi:hypothetical protein